MQIKDDAQKDGLKILWDDGFMINVSEIHNSIIIKASKAGCVSLARIFLSLAQEEIKSGYHVHLDDSNSLEDGSKELVIERV